MEADENAIKMISTYIETRGGQFLRPTAKPAMRGRQGAQSSDSAKGTPLPPPPPKLFKTDDEQSSFLLVKSSDAEHYLNRWSAALVKGMSQTVLPL